MEFHINMQGLLKIAENEQQMLQRADQKAMGLISLIGVFCVFFITYYTSIQPNLFNLIFLTSYFIAVLLAIIFLMLVIFPRYNSIRKKGNKLDVMEMNTNELLKSYSFTNYLEKFYGVNKQLESDRDVFNNYISSLGKINLLKSKNLKRGIIAFISAIISEMIIILSIYFNLYIVSFTK